jgi:hypothetical protein
MNDFSPHLFWDTDPDQVDLEKNRTWLVRRVLEKGLWSDWKLLLQLLGKDQIRTAIQNMRHLEDRATSFACAVLNLERSELRCFTQKSSQSIPWNY